MERFYQMIGVALVSVVLMLSLQKQGKDVALLLSVLVCSMVAILAAEFLEPVVRFIQKMQQLGSLDEGYLETLLKVVGICFTAEIAGHICEDAGTAALGKILQFLAGAAILYLSLPMLNGLLELVEGILEQV